MISRDTIIDLARKLQTSEINVTREYCQHMFLRAWYQQKQAGVLWFKGGTALRLAYKSPRFSEDLDFEHGKKTLHDFNRSDVKLIEDVLTETVGNIQNANVAVDIEEAKSTSGGYIAKIAFSLHEKRIDVLIFFLTTASSPYLANSSSRGSSTLCSHEKSPGIFLTSTISSGRGCCRSHSETPCVGHSRLFHKTRDSLQKN